MWISFQIKEEILAVLNHIIQGEKRHGSVSDLRHMSAQTVFSLLDHLTNFTRHRVVALYQMAQKEVQMTRSRAALESKCECPAVCHLLPPATKLGQGYIFTGVCDSVHREGGVPGQVPTLLDQIPPPGRYTPQPGRYPPGRYTPLGPGTPPGWYPPPGPGTPPGQAGTPLGRYPPPEQCILGDTGNKWAVRILLECILVWSD